MARGWYYKGVEKGRMYRSVQRVCVRGRGAEQKKQGQRWTRRITRIERVPVQRG